MTAGPRPRARPDFESHLFSLLHPDIRCAQATAYYHLYSRASFTLYAFHV